MSQATVSVSWNADRSAPMTDTWFYDAGASGEGKCVVFLLYRIYVYIYIDISRKFFSLIFFVIIRDTT